MENNTRSKFDWMFTGQNPTDYFAPSCTTGNGHRYSHQQPPLTTTNVRSSSLLPEMTTHHSDRYPPLLPETHDQFNPYNLCCCNFHAGVAGFDHHHRSSLSDRNLEIIFDRLNLSSPNHHHQTSSRNNNLGTVFSQNPSYTNNPVINSHLLQLRQQSKRTVFSTSLTDLRGKILQVAKDQEGCQFLQNKCEEGKPENIEMIFNEVKDHVYEVVTDASMNYLAQKLFKVCNERQMRQIVVAVVRDDDNLTNICLNSHGTRAMQKLIEVLTSAEHRFLMVSALSRIAVTLTKNTNGHHVIQHCLKSFHVDQVQPILNVVADNCLDIATDKSGCCVLQQCVLHAEGSSKERLMTEIIENALHLAEHPYGNYVVQHILGMHEPDATAGILQKLAGNFVYLAMNKYGSNVVEKCLKDVPDNQSMPIIHEIIHNPNFLLLIQHPFGNYVAQSALQTAKGSMKEMMISIVQKEYPLLHSHPHGKRVLALARNSKPRGSHYA